MTVFMRLQTNVRSVLTNLAANDHVEEDEEEEEDEHTIEEDHDRTTAAWRKRIYDDDGDHED